MTLCYGLARLSGGITKYNPAKREDFRNAMWYNDNNLAAADQVTSDVNQYVFGTFSRYARKLRRFHDAKIAAMAAYLAQLQVANPDMTIVFSGPGEAEMNFYRLGSPPGQADRQYFFNDYSPFAVLEFRDWIQHAGLYADGEKYAGQGYVNGGAKYQGPTGLAQFNADFSTAFTSWDLCYYNWSLADDMDSDSNALPFSGYAFGGQLPTSGDHFIAGGFDPPRVMQSKGASAYYDLWHAFREQLVANYVKDMAAIVRDSDFPRDQYFTHQIPADHLVGTNPTHPILNERYYSSASPLWSADAFSDIGMAITLYDIKIGTALYETSKYAVDAISSMSSNWGALEYNPEVNVQGAVLSPVADLYAKMMKLYQENVHCISFFKWLNTNEEDYAYKDTDRGVALSQFFNAIRDKARQPVDTVFTPPKVNDFAGAFNAGNIDLTWNAKIWSDLQHEWSHWGDFKEFVIYRGTTQDFSPDDGAEIARTSAYAYTDSGFDPTRIVYYKIVAVNKLNQSGPVSAAIAVIPSADPTAIMNVSREHIYAGANTTGIGTGPQGFLVSNEGTADLLWTASVDQTWLSVVPISGTNAGKVLVAVNPAGLAAGDYTGVVTLTDTNALNSPCQVMVHLAVKASTTAPFGSFDIPLDNSDAVGNIPVSGWALDDIEVVSVKVWRDPVSGEPVHPNGYVFIGDGVFVEGARPDVEPHFPDTPLNYRAGWGYMLLTNFLPNSGNGTFVLHVTATDKEGNTTDLGARTIICDNASAVKPFGTIDTPAQGGETSGNAYVNFGWALTPQPNAIPTDGSTITVWLNSVPLAGHVDYNHYREDIATLFPGYANSNGAVGFYVLDTTAYANGVHNIAWSVTDDAGNTDGIGSRFFAIVNTAAPGSTSSANTVQKIGTVPTVEQLKMMLPDLSAVKVEDHSRMDGGRLVCASGEFNQIVLATRVTEGVTVDLNPDQRPDTRFSGYLQVGDELRRLPIGSTLDTQNNTFYWRPGPGFYSTYDLVFLDNHHKLVKRIRIAVR